MIEVLIKSVSSTNDACFYCERDFRRVKGLHVPSQQKGMIPVSSCARVFAAQLDDLRWIAYVDGEVVRYKKSGETRYFPTAIRAYRAACRAAPRGGHP